LQTTSLLKCLRPSNNQNKPIFSTKPNNISFSLRLLALGGGGGGAPRCPPVQIALRRRAIGSARNQYLLILARMQQPTLSI
jgi:hypothetical protein